MVKALTERERHIGCDHIDGAAGMVASVAKRGFEFFEKGGRIGTTKQKAIDNGQETKGPVLFVVEIEIDEWLLTGEQEACKALAAGWIAQQIALVFSPDLAQPSDGLSRQGRRVKVCDKGFEGKMGNARELESVFSEMKGFIKKAVVFCDGVVVAEE